MNRWTAVTYLESCGISLYEQAIFVSFGLHVYNNLGYRVIEKESGKPLPCGCTYLSGGLDSDGVGDIKYYYWIDAADQLTHLRYKTSELINFISEHKNEPRFYNIVHCLPSELFKQDDYKKEIESAKLKIKQLESAINKSGTNIENTLLVSYSKTSNAAIARQEKTRQDWILTVEKAVSLAVRCARNGKSKSTEQHKDMWRNLWGEEDNSLPRSQGFEAFRRGLPDDLKGNS